MRRSIAPFLVLAFAGCAGAEPRSEHPVYDDPATRIVVAPGGEFDVRIASNQSTGYRWMLVDSAALGPLRPGAAQYESPRSQNNGAGGRERWPFRASAPGDGVITLVYRRPWEPKPPIDTAVFRVTVR